MADQNLVKDMGPQELQDFAAALSRREMDNMIRRINRRIATYYKYGLQDLSVVTDIENDILSTDLDFSYAKGFIQINRTVANFGKKSLKTISKLLKANKRPHLKGMVGKKARQIAKEKGISLKQAQAEAFQYFVNRARAEAFIRRFINNLGGSPLEKSNIKGVTAEAEIIIDALHRENGRDITEMDYDELFNLADQVERDYDKMVPHTPVDIQRMIDEEEEEDE